MRHADGDPTVQLLLSLGHFDSSHGLGKCKTKPGPIDTENS